MTTKRKKKWCSSIPECCNICSTPVTDRFIDGRIRTHGSWAIMCTTCHAQYGVGLGLGCGQLYVKDTDGTFVKEK